MPSTVLALNASEKQFVLAMQRAAGSVGIVSSAINLKLVRSMEEATKVDRQFAKGIGARAEQFRSFGTALSLGVTLPMTLATKAASDAFQEYDSLRRALEAVEGSTEGANRRLAELQELAKRPGIGFKEAIQGEVRLRAIGVAAADSTKILTEFANALSFTGGGKEQLREVTVQLTQLIAKNKVIAQDLRPIIEAAPAVANALQKMYGTVASDDIAKRLESQGRSSLDFVRDLVGELEKMPRVASSYKNSMENISIAMFTARARIFEVLAANTDLVNTVDNLVEIIENLTQAFVDLPAPVQNAIFASAGLAAIIGPMSLTVGILASNARLLTIGFAKMGSGIKALISPTTLLLAALTSLAVDLYTEHELLDTSENLLRSNAAARNKVAADVVKQHARVNDLLGVLQDEKSSTEAVTMAKKELIQMNPEFEKMLKGDKINFKAAYEEAGRYIKELERLAKVKSLQLQLDASIQAENAIMPELIDQTKQEGLFDTVDDLYKEYLAQVDNMFEGAGEFSIKFGERTRTLAKNLSDVRNERDKIYEELTALQLAAPETKSGGAGGGGGDKMIETILGMLSKKDIEDAIDAIEAENYMLDEEIEVAKELVQKEKELFRELEKRKENWKDLDVKPISMTSSGDNSIKDPVTGELFWMSNLNMDNTLKNMFRENMETYNQNLRDHMEDVYQAKKEAAMRLTEMNRDLGLDVVYGISEALAGGEGLKGALKQSLMAFAAYTARLAQLMLPALKMKEALFANPTVGKAIALLTLSAGLRGAAGAIKVPRMAQGGVVDGMTMAILGDNRSGREMALPLERSGDFAKIIADHLPQGGVSGGLDFAATAKVLGNDLYLLIERIAKTKGKRA